MAALTDANIYTARDLWLSDRASAITTYGHISSWDTSEVTQMAFLFCADTDFYILCNSDAATFNDNITFWNTSGVTTMAGEQSILAGLMLPKAPESQAHTDIVACGVLCC